MNRSVLKDLGLFIFRLGVSYLMIAFHGLVKVKTLLGEEAIEFADPIGLGMELSFYLATFAEFLCSVLIVLGIWTRWAAIPLLTTMMVAVFGFHANDPFIAKQLPTLFMFCYILLIFMGGGRFSLGHLIGKKFR